MSQHRLFSAFLGLATLGVSTVGIPQISRAATLAPAPNLSPVATPALDSAIEIAQRSTDSASRSLSVTGIGQVSIPADQAVLVLSFYPNSFYSGSSDPNATPAQPQMQPNDLTSATAAANSAGVTEAKAYPDFTTPGAMRVRLMINQPTQAKLDQAIAAVTTALIKTNRYMSSGVSVGYGIRDCKAAEATVRQAAMADASRRAAALADVSGAQVGEVILLTESITWGQLASPACPLADDPASYADILVGYPLYDSSVPPALRVIYSLNASYSLR